MVNKLIHFYSIVGANNVCQDTVLNWITSCLQIDYSVGGLLTRYSDLLAVRCFVPLQLV